MANHGSATLVLLALLAGAMLGPATAQSAIGVPPSVQVTSLTLDLDSLATDTTKPALCRTTTIVGGFVSSIVAASPAS
jgi:hypothetical protein